MGISFLSFIAGMQTVDVSLYEAGMMDGIKNRFQELWYITLPAMVPQLLFGAIMQIISAFTVADVSVQAGGSSLHQLRRRNHRHPHHGLRQHPL